MGALTQSIAFPSLIRNVLVAAVVFFVGTHAVAAQPATPVSTPQLVLETGGHAAPVWRIATDTEGRRLVSVSIDKTARVWNVATGQLERVLRVPIGAGGNGRLWAVAMSPDGKQVAVSGNTFTGGPAPNIYVFDPASGALIKRIAANPVAGAVVGELAWSSDGRYLASGQSRAGGMRVFRTSDWTVVGEDRNIASAVVGLGFDRVGHLFAGSADGVVRRYRLADAGIELVATKSLARKSLRRLRVSPDGTRLAVVSGATHYDVEVFNADTLDPMFSITVATGDRNGIGGLDAVAWSHDGAELLAAGTCCVPIDPRARALIRANNVVFRWTGVGSTGYRRTELPPYYVWDLVPLPGGRMAFATAEPGIGIVEKDARVRFLASGDLVDLRGSAQSLAVSHDGRSVRFSYQRYDGAPVFYDFEQFGWSSSERDSSLSGGLAPAITSAPGVKLNDWWAWPPRRPELDGKPLTEGPAGRAVAFAPDKRTFAFALSDGLRLYDTTGKQLWRRSTAIEARGVVISGDGRLVVTANDDGTIRWYRHSDGVHLLTLFPHADRKRWVAWTAQGYFVASVGGEELFGWHVNRGLDRAGEFYPASRLFDERFRPDIVLEVLKSAETDRQVIARLKIKERVNIAEGFRLPPAVEVLAPATGQVFEERDIALKLALQDRGGGIGELRLFHNGKAVALDVMPGAGARTGHEQRLALVEGENVLTVSALSVEGVESEPVTVKVIRRAPPVAPALHALVVGIDRYKNPALNLSYAQKDAQAIAGFFSDVLIKRLYREAHVRILLNEEATGANIRKALDQLALTAAKEDTVVLYFAGHGETADEEWYFVPHEVTEPESDKVLSQGGLSRQFLQDLLKKLPAQKVLVLLDACKSGAAASGTRGIVDRRAIMNLARATGTYIVAASGADQLAAEVPTLGHGVFTWTLLEGLGGKAGAKRITAESLILYVKNRMPEVSERFRGRPQFPVSWGGGSDFPLVVRE